MRTPFQCRDQLMEVLGTGAASATVLKQLFEQLESRLTLRKLRKNILLAVMSFEIEERDFVARAHMTRAIVTPHGCYVRDFISLNRQINPIHHTVVRKHSIMSLTRSYGAGIRTLQTYAQQGFQAHRNSTCPTVPCST